MKKKSLSLVVHAVLADCGSSLHRRVARMADHRGDEGFAGPTRKVDIALRLRNSRSPPILEARSDFGSQGALGDESGDCFACAPSTRHYALGYGGVMAEWTVLDGYPRELGGTLKYTGVRGRETRGKIDRRLRRDPRRPAGAQPFARESRPCIGRRDRYGLARTSPSRGSLRPRRRSCAVDRQCSGLTPYAYARTAKQASAAYRAILALLAEHGGGAEPPAKSVPTSAPALPPKRIVADNGFDVGDAVEHVRFGRGTVVDIEGTGPAARVTVDVGGKERTLPASSLQASKG